LKDDVPLILGIDFLVKVAPHVDWKTRKITCYVRNRKYVLPTCDYTNDYIVYDDNTFAGLAVDDVDTCTSNSQPELHSTVTNSKNSNKVALGERLSNRPLGAENCPTPGLKRRK